MTRARHSTLSPSGGSTLLEAMIACCIVSLFFAGLYQMNWRGIFLLKSGIDGASASQVLTNLAEQIRTANWNEITDPTYLSGTILANSTGTGHLPAVVQTIDVYPYPTSGSPSGMAIEVTRDASGNVTTPTAGNGKLSTSTTVRVDLTLSWNTALNQNPHTRMLSLIINQAGISGQN
jgi:hypothetical protein